MKRLFTLTLFICLVQITVAQDYSHEFGKCTIEELNLNQYAKDPVTEAVVIYDIGQSRFITSESGLDILFEHRIKIKIFSKAGLKWAEIPIAYYQENDKQEQIFDLVGNTYNIKNGQVKISPLNTSSTFDEKINKNWHNMKIAMPDVKEGSVIEVSYKIRSPYVFTFRNWDFQKSIPVIFSEYTTRMVPFYEYSFILQGASKFDDYKTFVDKGLPSRFADLDYQDVVYIYTMKNLPAFRDESYITSRNDYLIKLDFQLSTIHRTNGVTEEVITTWPKLSEELLKSDLLGKYIKACKIKSKDFLDSLKSVPKNLTDKADMIERFVKNNFKWDGDDGYFATKNLKDFIKTKTGNTANINLFLTGMLNAAGIEANPVIISTRDHGKIRTDYPFAHYFNSVLVLAKLDSASFLLDATEPLSNFAEIPTRSINEKGLVIQKDKVEWVNLKSNSVSTKIYYFNLKPDPTTDSIFQKCRFVTTGYEAIVARKNFTNSYKELQYLLTGNNAVPGDVLIPIELNKSDKPFEIDFNKKSTLESVEDKIILSPFGNFIYSENPLKQNVRNYPVDFIYKKLYAFETTITIPAGYKLFTKPENMRIEDSMIRIIYSANVVNKDTIKVIGVYEFKRDEYNANEYLYLKDYFNKIVDKFNEKVVLIKG